MKTPVFYTVPGTEAVRVERDIVSAQHRAGEVAPDAVVVSPGRGHHIHDPDVALVFSPGEIEVAVVSRKPVADASSSTREPRESRDPAIVQRQFPQAVILSRSSDDTVVHRLAITREAARILSVGKRRKGDRLSSSSRQTMQPSLPSAKKPLAVG